MGLSRAQLVGIAEETGATVYQAWSGHNAGPMGTIEGVILHHTGTGGSAAQASLRVVREGRSDLQNALCNYYIDRNGAIWCITEKKAWHAGYGNNHGYTDANVNFLGIEAESDGRTWTEATRVTFIRLVASILRAIGKDQSWAPRHADYALPPGRKIDFSGMDTAAFRAEVEYFRVNGFHRATPEQQEEEWLMGAREDIIGGVVKALVTDQHDGRSLIAREVWRQNRADLADPKSEVSKRLDALVKSAVAEALAANTKES